MKKNPGRKERRALARANRKAEGKVRHKLNIANKAENPKGVLRRLKHLFGM